MFLKKKSVIAPLLFSWLLICFAFVGAAEEWTVKECPDVVVDDTETEIVDSTYTDKKYNRKFEISNGESAIVVTAWGSNDGTNWDVMASSTIVANDVGWLILGKNHFWYVKLTGLTSGGEGSISTVDAFLYYREVV